MPKLIYLEGYVVLKQYVGRHHYYKVNVTLKLKSNEIPNIDLNWTRYLSVSRMNVSNHE